MKGNREIVRAFKSKGLTLSAAASRYLFNVLAKYLHLLNIKFTLSLPFQFLFSEEDFSGSLDLILDGVRELVEKNESKLDIYFFM